MTGRHEESHGERPGRASAGIKLNDDTTISCPDKPSSKPRPLVKKSTTRSSKVDKPQSGTQDGNATSKESDVDSAEEFVPSTPSSNRSTVMRLAFNVSKLTNYI